MATKNKPGAYDCYTNAEPDEPMFVLLARDELAPALVRIWAMVRDGAPLDMVESQLSIARSIAAAKPPMDQPKFEEAIACSHDMDRWQRTRNSIDV